MPEHWLRAQDFRLRLILKLVPLNTFGKIPRAGNSVEMETDAEKYYSQITRVFDTVADGYDSPAMRYFSSSAENLANILHPAAGEKILDVATGTGEVAIACARAVLPGGNVIGIDLSERMLEQAKKKAVSMGAGNIDFFNMNAAMLDFKSDYFNHVVCGFGLFFLPDMSAALREWVRVTKPGGKIAFTSFTHQAFAPMIEMFVESVEQFDVEMQKSPLASQRLSNIDQCLDVMQSVQLQDCKVETRQLGYYLQNADDWWEIVKFSGLRRLFDRLQEKDKDGFKTRHLDSIQSLFTDRGLWLNVEVLISQGKVPSQSG